MSERYSGLLSHWKYFGFGASVFAYLCALQTVTVVNGHVGVAITCFACSAIAAIVIAMVIDTRGYDAFFSSRISAIVAAFVYAIGSLLVFLVPGNIAFFVGAALLGMAGTFIWFLWCRNMTLLNEHAMIAFVLMSMVIFGALGYGGEFYSDAPPLVIGMVFCAFASFCYVRKDIDDSEVTVDSHRERLGYRPIDYSSRLVVSAIALLVTVAFCSRFGSQTIFSAYYATFSIGYIVEALVGVILLLLFLVIDRIGILSVCRILLPVSVATLLLESFVDSVYVIPLIIIWATSMRLAIPFLFIVLFRLAHIAPRRHGIVFGSGVLACVIADSTAVLLAQIVNSQLGLNTYPLIQNMIIIMTITTVAVFVLPGYWYVSHEDSSVDLMDHMHRVDEYGKSLGLTDREREVLRLIAKGESEQSMADTLFVSKGTVHTHISHIYRKLDVHGREELLGLLEDHVESTKLGSRSRRVDC